MAGKNAAFRAAWAALNWLRVAVEMSRPMPSTRTRKDVDTRRRGLAAGGGALGLPALPDAAGVGFHEARGVRFRAVSDDLQAGEVARAGEPLAEVLGDDDKTADSPVGQRLDHRRAAAG